MRLVRGQSSLRRKPPPFIALRTAGVASAIVAGCHVHGSASGSAVAHAIADHGLLTAAMMLPLAGSSAVLVAERALRSRRRRAIGEHVIGFSAIWLGFGMCAGAMIALLQDFAAPEMVFAGLSGAAAVWQITARRRRAADRCGYVHVGPPSGWRCDVHTIAAGTRHAVPCLRTCGPPMAAMVAAPHPLVMFMMFAAYLWEWTPGANPFPVDRRTRPAPVYAVLALGAVAALAA
jgi:hypothetical protein